MRLPCPLRSVPLFEKHLQKAPGKCTVATESRESMPINDPIESTLGFPLGARPSSCRIHRAPAHCSHRRPLRIGLVNMRSHKELFLRLYVERVFRSNMRGWCQGYRGSRRNRRTLHNSWSHTCKKDDRCFRCRLLALTAGW